MAAESRSQAYERGLQSAEERKHTEALEQIGAHLREHPNDSQALNDVGVILYCMGRNEEAIEHLEKARQTAQAAELPEINWNLCEVSRAPERCKMIVRMSGEDACTYSAEDIGWVNIPDNGWTQHYDFVKELGDCHAAVGEYDEAQACYDKAANLAPDEAGPYVGTGVVQLQKGNLTEAEAALGVACRLDPVCSKAYCGLAMISQQRNDSHTASDLYLKSLELDNDNLTALLGLFQLSCRMGAFSEVIHSLEVYLDMHPGDISVMFCLATLHLKDGRFREAKKLLNDVLALEPTNGEAANLLEEVEHMLAQKNNQEISA